jgi:alpha-glucosidase
MTAWWHNCVGYQVYVPSFQDSNGDGWGDLPGITSRLDYLRDLGIDLIWLTPVHPSPMRDHGYDVADYRDVDPRYGSLADFDWLLGAAHRRGIRVIADLVVNHTSSAHPWFIQARESHDSQFRDYYIWRDPRPDGGPPNNWLSHFGGPAWTFDDRTGQYYLHLFTPDQPDLNWANPRIAAEVDEILRFWLGRGLDGFRIDTAHYLTKHPQLPDNPLVSGDQVPRLAGIAGEWLRQEHRYDIVQPSALDIHRRWRAIADEHNAFLVGEVYILDPDRLAKYVRVDGLHSAFWFGLVESGWEPAGVSAMLAAATAASPHLSWVQSSHDRRRAVSRYGGDPRRALCLATLLAGLPGPYFLYYGDELGLPDAVITAAQQQDPLAMADGGANGRDGARTPMPWNPRPGLGFSDATTPWLAFGDRVSTDTVEVQAADPYSPWSITRRLLRARGEIGDGPLVWSDDRAGIVRYRRGNVLVAANLRDRPARVEWPAGPWRLLFHTDPRRAEPPIELGPYEAVIAVSGARTA